MSRWHTQEDVDMEILWGLAAARMTDVDLRPFEDALADKHQEMGASGV